MKINSSQVQMGSSRSYSKVSGSGRPGITGGFTTLQMGNAVSLSFSGESLSRLKDSGQNRPSGQQPGRLGRSQRSSRPDDGSEDGTLLTLKKILASLRQAQSKKTGIPSSEISLQQKSSFTFSSSFSFSASFSAGVWNIGMQTSSFMSETENTTFSTLGTAVTEDGREISFHIDLEMSRSFLEETRIVSPGFTGQVMTDPLVINLGSNTASVSDQKFLFDIDADGKMDSISQLSGGSGFLALDKNNDGKINDGNELFGTKSGDGFRDLASYDKDRNGWVDENDEVFSKLKIWVKDENGKDKLLSLKEAGVGAIYLGNASTDFSLNDASSNRTNAQIKKTGIFLKENGGAGTMQHVDFAV